MWLRAGSRVRGKKEGREENTPWEDIDVEYNLPLLHFDIAFSW
jgi:hypothetical protein